MLSHRNVLTAVLNPIAAYDPSAVDRYLMAFPIFPVAGYCGSWTTT